MTTTTNNNNNMTTEQQREVVDLHRHNLQMIPTQSLDIRPNQSHVREIADDVSTPDIHTPRDYPDSLKEDFHQDDANLILASNKPQGIWWILFNASIFIGAFI